MDQARRRQGVMDGMSEDSYNLRYLLPSRCIEKGFRSGHCLLALSAWSGAYDSVLALDGKLPGTLDGEAHLHCTAAPALCRKNNKQTPTCNSWSPPFNHKVSTQSANRTAVSSSQIIHTHCRTTPIPPIQAAFRQHDVSKIPTSPEGGSERGI